MPPRIIVRSAHVCHIAAFLAMVSLAGCDTPEPFDTHITLMASPPRNQVVSHANLAQLSQLDASNTSQPHLNGYVVTRDAVDSRWIYVIATPRQLNAVNTLYASHDGGRTWTALRTPLGSHIQQVHFVDRSTGVIYGAPDWDPSQGRPASPPAAYRTVDGGQHWSPVSLPGSLIAESKRYGRPDVRFLDTPGRLAWMFCYWNNQFPKFALYHSSDDGVTWTAATVSIGPESYLTVPAMGAIDASQAYLVTYCEKCAAGPNMTGTNTLLHTLDGGRTWQRVPLPFRGTSRVTSLRFTDSAHGTATIVNAITGHATRYATRDGGRTWTQVP